MKLRRWTAISLPSAKSLTVSVGDVGADPPADERRRDRVVDPVDPDEGVLAGPRLELVVGVGSRLGQWCQERELGGEPLGDPAAEPPDVAAIGDVGRPGVVLVLEVGQVGELAERQKARLGIADRPLGVALRGRPGRAQDDRLCAKYPEQPDHLVGEPCPGAGAEGDDRCIVVEDELLGHAAEPLEAAQERRAQVTHRPGTG
jgi:hypothetical protein